MHEGNAIQNWVIANTPAPWVVGLLASKLLAVLIGRHLYRTGRIALLQRANAGYSLVVGWNLDRNRRCGCGWLNIDSSLVGSHRSFIFDFTLRLFAVIHDDTSKTGEGGELDAALLALR